MAARAAAAQLGFQASDVLPNRMHYRLPPAYMCPVVHVQHFAGNMSRFG